MAIDLSGGGRLYSSSRGKFMNTKRDAYGQAAVEIPGGVYLTRPQYRWSIKERAYVRFKRVDSALVSLPENPSTNIDFQTPENPGIKTTQVSAYGVTIAASIGKRLLAGNIVDASELVPRLVGYREYYTEERVYPLDTGGVG